MTLPSVSFRKSFLHLFIPAATQSLFFNLIGIFDVLMVGQLGDVSVAAVGLANQFFFLLNITLFGVSSGAAVFVAQYWGAEDLPNVHRVHGLSLAAGASVAGVFAITALAFPGFVMGLYTQDQAVIELGVSYLRIIGWSYIFTAVAIAYSMITRSTGNTRLPMLVSVVFLSLNMLINYCLIFGKLGLPVLGVSGAAVGTTTCRILECVTLLLLLYRQRSPAAAIPRQLFNLNIPFITHHLRLIFLIFLSEFFWALGVSVYNAIFSRLSTQAYAAYNIASTFQSLGMSLTFGCITTCGIMVGHQIGAGRADEAFETSRRVLLISVLGSAVIGVCLALAREPLMDLYQVSPTARADSSAMLLIVGCSLWLRSMDGMFIVGILRSGGDTRYSTFLDVGAIWLAGIPAMALAAFVFKLPAAWVFLAIYTENLVKNALGLRRFLSRRWIRNLTRAELANPSPIV